MEPFPSRPVERGSEPGRAIFHVIATNSAMMYYYFTDLVGAYALLVLGVIFVALDFGRVRSPRVRRALPRFVLALVREEERRRVSPIAHFVFAAVLVDVLYLFFGLPKDVILPAVLFISIGDPLARIVGRRFGSRTIPGTGKTVAGSLAFFVSGGLAAVLVCTALGAQWTWLVVLGGGLFATLVELYSRWWDNFTIPFFTTLAMWGLSRL